MCALQAYPHKNSPLFLTLGSLTIISEPQTQASLPPPPSLLICNVFFLHQLQTSITHSFFKLEHFLRPFFLTFRSIHIFLEVPQKGVKT